MFFLSSARPRGCAPPAPAGEAQPRVRGVESARRGWGVGVGSGGGNAPRAARAHGHPRARQLGSGGEAARRSPPPLDPATVAAAKVY